MHYTPGSLAYVASAQLPEIRRPIQRGLTNIEHAPMGDIYHIWFGHFDQCLFNFMDTVNGRHVGKIKIYRLVQMGTYMCVLVHQLSGSYMGISNPSHYSPNAPNASVLTVVDTTK